MTCRFNHDGDCCNSGATQYMCKCKLPCDTIWPLINADRIRAMDNETMADYMATIHGCPENGVCAAVGWNCKTCWLNWLELLM